MEEYTGCHFKTKKSLIPGVEFDVQVFDVQDAGLVVVAVPPPMKSPAASQLTRVFASAELEKAQIVRSVDGFSALVDSLSIVDLSTRYGVTSIDSESDNPGKAAGPQASDLALDSSLEGVAPPSPLLTRKAAGNYLLNVLVNGARNTPKNRLSSGRLTELLTKALTELCRQKPPGLEAVKWLGHWLLEHNPNQPQIHVA